MKCQIYFITFFFVKSCLLAQVSDYDSIAVKRYDTILEGLNKSYVVDYTYADKYSICYRNRSKHRDSIMVNDSALYYKSVKDFFNCDSGIVFYLLTFEKDSSECFWIRKRCMYKPNKTRMSFLINLKYIAALILIENYLTNYNDSIIHIPRVPNINWVDNSQPVTLLDYKTLKDWVYRIKSTYKMRYFFENTFRPWYRTYDFED